MRMRTRAIVGPVIGAASAIAVVAALPAGGAQAADLVVNAFGGVWEKAFRECYVAEFEKRSGKSVVVVVGNPIQLMNQVEANRAKPPIDVIVNTIDGAYDAIKRGLVDPFDDASLPHLKEINPDFVKAGRGFGTILNYGAMGLAYNTKTVKNPPKDWKAFVDGTVKGEWRAAVPSINYLATTQTTLWMFSHVYGGGIDDVTPGIEVLKKMKASGNLIFWSDVNQFLNLLKSGEIDIGMYWDGRTWAYQDAGNPTVSYINPKPGAVINPTLIQKIKNGSPLGYQFIDVTLEQGPQARFGNQLQYGMSNTKVTFDAKVQPRITKMDEILWPPFEQAPAHFSRWVERWNKEIGG